MRIGDLTYYGAVLVGAVSVGVAVGPDLVRNDFAKLMRDGEVEGGAEARWRREHRRAAGHVTHFETRTTCVSVDTTAATATV
jgi:hypothetical protein